MIKDFIDLNNQKLEQIAQETRRRAYEIIECKGATYYGIASCVTDICEAILFDQKQIFPISCYIKEYDTCLSMPVVLGVHGVESIVPTHLNETEQKQLQESAIKIKKITSTLGI